MNSTNNIQFNDVILHLFQTYESNALLRRSHEQVTRKTHKYDETHRRIFDSQYT